MADADFGGLAAASGAECLPGGEEAVIVPFLDGVYRVTRADVTALTGDLPTVWVKIPLLIYRVGAAIEPPTFLPRR